MTNVSDIYYLYVPGWNNRRHNACGPFIPLHSTHFFYFAHKTAYHWKWWMFQISMFLGEMIGDIMHVVHSSLLSGTLSVTFDMFKIDCWIISTTYNFLPWCQVSDNMHNYRLKDKTAIFLITHSTRHKTVCYW